MKKIALREEVAIFASDDKIVVGAEPRYSVTLSNNKINTSLLNALDGTFDEEDLIQKLDVENSGTNQDEIRLILRRLKSNNLVYNLDEMNKHNNEIFDRTLRYLQILNLGSAIFEKSKIQNLIRNSSVIVFGVGGIGSNVVLNLAMSGVGAITIVDYDTVDISNRNRNVNFNVDSLEETKINALKKYINKNYPWCEVTAINKKITNESDAIDCLRDGFDCVVSAVDSPLGIHLVISDACCNFDIPMIRGGYTVDYGGIDAMYIPRVSSCFRCQKDVKESDPNHVAGVQIRTDRYIAPSALWVVNTIASLMTEQIIAYITKCLPLTLINTYVRIDFSEFSLTKFSFEPRQSCKHCK